MTKVSVLIPTYNTKEKWLKESLQSILDQTFQDFEIIVLDDGSDHSPEAAVLSFHDDRIKFYKNETNLGVGKTRNKLLDLATGEYIAFQDADDISDPSRLEKQVQFLDTNPDFSGVSAGMVSTLSGTEKTNPPSPLILDFLGGCTFSQNCALLRSKDFKDCSLRYDASLRTSEDYDLWARAVVKGLKFANLQEILLKYRQVATSLVHTQGRVGTIVDRQIKEFLLDHLTNQPILRREVAKVVSRNDRKKCSWKERIFSVRNEWDGLQKYKILQIFGLKIKLKKKTVKE